MTAAKGPEPMSQVFVLACAVALLYLGGNAAFVSRRLDAWFFPVPGLGLAADGWLALLGIVGCVLAGVVLAVLSVRNLWSRN